MGFCKLHLNVSLLDHRCHELVAHSLQIGLVEGFKINQWDLRVERFSAKSRFPVSSEISEDLATLNQHSPKATPSAAGSSGCSWEAKEHCPDHSPLHANGLHCQWSEAGARRPCRHLSFWLMIYNNNHQLPQCSLRARYHSKHLHSYEITTILRGGCSFFLLLFPESQNNLLSPSIRSFWAPL